MHILEIENALTWLAEKGYLKEVDIENAWDASINQYKLRWKAIGKKLGVNPPYPLTPISPEQLEELEET